MTCSEVPGVIESGDSDMIIAATLNQDDRSTSVIFKMLNPDKRYHSTVEKQVYAVTEIIRN